MSSGMRVSIRSLATTLGVALLAAIATPGLRASDVDKKTEVTFSAPVEVPGMTLPAGSYVFKTLPNVNGFVLIYSKDENHLVTIVPAVPIETVETPSTAKIELTERAAKAPEALHAWFYPGDNTGFEFLYRGN